MARSAYYPFRLVLHLCPFLEEKDCGLLLHAPIISWLNSCNVLNVELPPKVVRNFNWCRMLKTLYGLFPGFPKKHLLHCVPAQSFILSGEQGDLWW